MDISPLGLTINGGVNIKDISIKILLNYYNLLHRMSGLDKHYQK